MALKALAAYVGVPTILIVTLTPIEINAQLFPRLGVYWISSRLVCPPVLSSPSGLAMARGLHLLPQVNVR